MSSNNNLPLYRFCTSATIGKEVGKLVSIVGRVTHVDTDHSCFTIETSPNNKHTVTVLVTDYTINYMPDKFDRSKLKGEEAKKLAGKHISLCESMVRGDKAMEGGWFLVEEKMEEQVDRQSTEQGSFIRHITTSTFKSLQYVEVRGVCVNANRVEMHEFTDYENSFDLSGFNLALNVGLTRLPALFA